VTNVYVAGAYSDKKRIRREMDFVIGCPGLTLVHDWVKVIDEVTDGDQSREATLSPDLRREHARSDLQYALDADVFWFLVPGAGGRGCWFESGVICQAKARINTPNRPPIVTIASGPYHTVSIFTELFDYKFAQDVEAFDFIRAQGWK
jgi:hypothetical protein